VRNYQLDIAYLVMVPAIFNQETADALQLADPSL